MFIPDSRVLDTHLLLLAYKYLASYIPCHHPHQDNSSCPSHIRQVLDSHIQVGQMPNRQGRSRAKVPSQLERQYLNDIEETQDSFFIQNFFLCALALQVITLLLHCIINHNDLFFFQKDDIALQICTLGHFIIVLALKRLNHRCFLSFVFFFY